MPQYNNKDTRNRSAVFTSDCERISANVLIQIFAVILHNKHFCQSCTEAVTRRCFVKKLL